MEMELGLGTQAESARWKEEHESCGRLIHYHDGREIAAGYDMYPGQEYLVGRDQDCNIEIFDQTVSGRHIRLHAIGYANDHETDPVAPLIFAQDLSMNGTELHRVKDDADPSIPTNLKTMSRGDAPVLLHHGDKLYVSPTEWIQFHCDKWQSVSISTAWGRLSKEAAQFDQYYSLSRRLIGTGGTSRVQLGYSKVDGSQVACKIVRLDISHPFRRRLARKADATERLRYHVPEVEFLHELHHPNIVAIERIFYSEATAYIFQELVTAGDLLSFVLSSEEGRLDDTITAVIIRQVLQAISFLHNKQIVHRDLKPDNIMMTSLQPGARIVLTDFGLARRVEDVLEPQVIASPKKPIKRLFSLVGTEDYRAPEILFLHQDAEVPGYCGKSIDMWSIGIITAVLLAGTQFGLEEMMKKRHPGREIMKFAAMSSFRAIETDPHSDWRRVGKRPKDFIRKLVTVEANRITANEALDHSWFTNHHHTKLFDVLYERAVLDKWKPRPVLYPITVELDPIALPPIEAAGSEYFPVRDGSASQQGDDEEELEEPSPDCPALNSTGASHKRVRIDFTQVGAQEQTVKSRATGATTSRFFDVKSSSTMRH